MSNYVISAERAANHFTRYAAATKQSAAKRFGVSVEAIDVQLDKLLDRAQYKGDLQLMTNAELAKECASVKRTLSLESVKTLSDAYWQDMACYGECQRRDCPSIYRTA